MQEYSYVIEDNSINLEDYEFNEWTVGITPIVKPKPSELSHSTRTVTLSLCPEIDFEQYNTYYPKFKELGVSEDDFKGTITSRIIKDGINLDDFYKALVAKIKKSKGKYNSEYLSKILPTESNFIDIEKLYTHTELTLDEINSIVIRDHPIRSITGYTTTKRGFRNQITFRILSRVEETNHKKTSKTPRNINVMLFQNGKCTITGCRSSEEITNIVNIIIAHISKMNDAGNCITRPEYNKLHIEDTVCHSMNYHFNLNFAIDNSQLYTILQAENEKSNFKLFYFLDFDPERFAGLKFRFNEDPERNFKGSLCILFQTGSINIYRSSSETEIEWVYSKINEWATQYYDEIKA
jgi:TATA-box binding protein (TBP) (component of TFIID and TFIIIB)